MREKNGIRCYPQGPGMAVPHGTSAGTLNGGASACIGDPMVPSFDVPGALPFETIFPILGFVYTPQTKICYTTPHYYPTYDI